MSRNAKTRLRAGLFGCLLLASQAWASPIQITIDTSSLAGTVADLVFDLFDGGPPPNSVTISGFATDGTLGSNILPTGDVTGTLPGAVILGDSSSFSEYFQDITLSNSLSFVFDTTGGTAEPGSNPDGFAFSLLDADTQLPLFPPDGDPLFLYSIGEADPLLIFNTDVVQAVELPPGTAPEPGALALAMAGMLVLTVVRTARR